MRIINIIAGASPCASNPCLNSGKCVLRPNGVDYTCKFLLDNTILYHYIN